MNLKNLIAAVALMVVADSVTAGIEEGVAAYNNDDFKKAIDELYPFANQGNPEAQYYLGEIYSNGYGVSKDKARGQLLISQSANQGFDLAEFSLGISSLFNNADKGVAISWFRRAGSMGQLWLSGMYLNGDGVPQNKVVAYALSKLYESSLSESDKADVSSAKSREEQLEVLSDIETKEGQDLLVKLKASKDIYSTIDQYLSEINKEEISGIRVSLEPPDLYKKMNNDFRWTIFIDGPIDKKSPQLIKDALEKTNGNGAEIYFNSQGGSLLSGIEIGRIIRSYGASTNIGKKVIGNDRVQAGECYSSCALAILGGVYRFNSQGNIYGVHRFSSTADASDSDLDTAQIISAAVSSYIREMDVDPALFDLMVSAGKDEINILSLEQRERLRVVNYGRQRASWTIEIQDNGLQYLQGKQISFYGIGVSIFACTSEGLLLHSIYEAGEEQSKSIAKGSRYHSLMIDGVTHQILPFNMSVNNKMLRSQFYITRRDAAAISQAKNVGHAIQMSPDAPTFVGYQIDIEDKDRQRIKSFLTTCETAAP